MASDVETEFELRLAFFGSVSVRVFSDVAEIMEREHPGLVALCGSHPLSEKMGATICLASRKEG